MNQTQLTQGQIEELNELLAFMDNNAISSYEAVERVLLVLGYGFVWNDEGAIVVEELQGESD